MECTCFAAEFVYKEPSHRFWGVGKEEHRIAHDSVNKTLNFHLHFDFETTPGRCCYFSSYLLFGKDFGSEFFL